MLGGEPDVEGENMSSDAQGEERNGGGLPGDDELEEPSTEKEPGQEPEQPKPDVPEPSHEAVGIGVIGRPLVDPEQARPAE
jgi:hypothetical protein